VPPPPRFRKIEAIRSGEGQDPASIRRRQTGGTGRGPQVRREVMEEGVDPSIEVVVLVEARGGPQTGYARSPELDGPARIAGYHAIGPEHHRWPGSSTPCLPPSSCNPPPDPSHPALAAAALCTPRATGRTYGCEIERPTAGFDMLWEEAASREKGDFFSVVSFRRKETTRRKRENNDSVELCGCPTIFRLQETRYGMKMCPNSFDTGNILKGPHVTRANSSMLMHKHRTRNR
jgi:hypothetical protein